MRYNGSMIVVKRLIWETSNIEHISRHDVTQEEVEQACHGSLLVKDARSGRVMIFGPQEGVWYPVTARSTDRGERRKYFQETGVKL